MPSNGTRETGDQIVRFGESEKVIIDQMFRSTT